MYILGIESSCDETAVAVVERGEHNRVLAEAIKSQIPLHARYGGVVPEIASRDHAEVIDRLAGQALAGADLTLDDIDLIALTQGPGLIGSLLIGLSFARGLSFANHIPIVPVDHIEAHLESPFIDFQDIEYPLLALVVSGGHTSLFYRKAKFEGELLARTRDDAAGEVMDKVAKFFGLGYPGGPILDRLYPRGEAGKYPFTVPRMSDGSEDFSFSGYKTAVLRYARQENIRRESQSCYDLIASFLNSVVEYLLQKTAAFAEKLEPKSVIVAGGVSRNTLLRKTFKQEFDRKNMKLYLPSPRYCTDNAAMVAWLGYEKYTAFPQNNYFDPLLNAYSRAIFTSRTKHR
jgi:N6-L-threonylcarbamoyladenine synthase